MYNYDVDKFINEGKEVYNLRSEIERVADEVSSKGFKHIVLTGVGGTTFELMSVKSIFDKYSTFNTQLLNAAELVIDKPEFINDSCIVITGSKSGDTPETVSACEFCQKRGAKVISFTGSLDYPLAKVSDYPIISTVGGMTNAYMKFYLFALRLIHNNNEFSQYNQFADKLSNLHVEVVNIQEKFEKEAENIADKYASEPYQIWIGSGILWGEINMFTMCILEEMQWMRTRAVTSPEFFHGTLELVDKDVLVYLIKGIDQYRPLDERVERFIVDKTDKLVTLDINDYRLNGFSNEFNEILSPIIFNALTRGRLAYHLERVTGHDLEMRRYYRQFKY